MRKTSSSLSSTSRIARSVAIASRQSEPETAALAHLRIEARFSTHARHGLFHNRQSDAGAGVSFLRMDAAKNLEDAITVIGVNADPVVGDGDTDVAVDG